ncbi:uncharacterized protein LOC114574429 [Exaiptasia diaphana]|uniref:Uncharacterized protein n=1 Tax=Exaiptasia diaphana TaxID=2652724 RepID=A0A913YCI8_EXADI|nr:uncharacterized protein LOC114574429 [Exaiptasia diaphana]
MFSSSKVKERTTSAESISHELEDRPGKLKRHGTLQSLEVFHAWAKDSFLRESTIDIMVKEHEIDCIPAVLALKQDDIALLGLPVGQQRLLEGAVEKLKQEYELVRPPTPITKINLDMPTYRSMLDFNEQEAIPEDTRSGSLRSFSSHGGESSLEVSRAFLGSLEREELLKNESHQAAKSAGYKNQGSKSKSPSGSPSRHPLMDNNDDEKDSEYSCQRFLLSILLMPFFLLICLMGVVLWLLMIPFLLCCPRDGCYANLVTDIYEHTVMAPWRACQWASTKRAITDAVNNKTKKYGGTIDEELGVKK